MLNLYGKVIKGWESHISSFWSVVSAHLWPWLIGPQGPDRTSRYPRGSKSPAPMTSVWAFQPHTCTTATFFVSKSIVLHTQGEVEARHKLWLGTFNLLQGKGSRIIQKMAVSHLGQEDPAPIIHCYLCIFSAYWTKCKNVKSALEITYYMERHWQNVLFYLESSNENFTYGKVHNRSQHSTFKLCIHITKTRFS